MIGYEPNGTLNISRWVSVALRVWAERDRQTLHRSNRAVIRKRPETVNFDDWLYGGDPHKFISKQITLILQVRVCKTTGRKGDRMSKARRVFQK